MLPDSSCDQVSESLPSQSNSSRVILWTSMIPLSKVGPATLYLTPMYPYPFLFSWRLSFWYYGNRFVPETVRHRRRGRPSRCSRYGRPGRIRVRIVVHSRTISTRHMMSYLFSLFCFFLIVPCESSTCGPVKGFYSSTRSPRGTRLRKSARFTSKSSA
jgi:hypothetical protein